MLKAEKALIVAVVLILLTRTAVAATIPDFGFDEMYREYFSGDFYTFKVIEMAGELYMTKIGSFVFWSILFAVVFIALYATTGGLFIPSAAFSVLGFILINAMPSELDAVAKIILAAGLFVVPIYQYIMR